MMEQTKMREGAQPSSDFFNDLEIWIVMARKRGIPLPYTYDLEELKRVAKILIKQREAHFRRLISKARRIHQRIVFLERFLSFIEKGGMKE